MPLYNAKFLLEFQLGHCCFHATQPRKHFGPPLRTYGKVSILYVATEALWRSRDTNMWKSLSCTDLPTNGLTGVDLEILPRLKTHCYAPSNCQIWHIQISWGLKIRIVKGAEVSGGGDTVIWKTLWGAQWWDLLNSHSIMRKIVSQKVSNMTQNRLFCK